MLRLSGSRYSAPRFSSLVMYGATALATALVVAELYDEVGLPECVLDEMLVGEPLYVGSSAQAVLAAPTTTRASIPANVDAAIRKALERLPADRFTRAKDLARALGD